MLLARSGAAMPCRTRKSPLIVDESAAERKRIVRLHDAPAHTPHFRRFTEAGVTISVRGGGREMVARFRVSRERRSLHEATLESNSDDRQNQQEVAFHVSTPLDKLHAFAIAAGSGKSALNFHGPDPSSLSTRSMSGIVGT
jgi:hypothetical protein